MVHPAAEEHGERVVREPEGDEEEPAGEDADIHVGAAQGARRSATAPFEFDGEAGGEEGADAAAEPCMVVHAEAAFVSGRAGEGAELDRPSLLGGDGAGADQRRGPDRDHHSSVHGGSP
jgi:hypothetical protein